MSWTDPCMTCGEPRYGCECKPNIPPPLTTEQLEKLKLQSEKNKEICSKLGHDWEYYFIVYTCKRCGETTNY